MAVLILPAPSVRHGCARRASQRHGSRRSPAMMPWSSGSNRRKGRMLACLVKGTYKPAGNGHTPPEEMERLLELQALCDHPPVHGGVIDVHFTFLYAFFDMACAQRIRHRPAHP